MKEYGSIAEYNNALARLEFAKGTTLKYNNVYISEGALPQCAQVRAVEYEKQHSHDLVLCQRPDSLAQPGQMCARTENEVQAPAELPAVKLTESPFAAPPPVLPVPAVAAGKSILSPAPITPVSMPATPTTEKVEFKSSPTPAPMAQPIPTTSVRPVGMPGNDLFLQPSSSLQGLGASTPR